MARNKKSSMETQHGVGTGEPPTSNSYKSVPKSAQTTASTGSRQGMTLISPKNLGGIAVRLPAPRIWTGASGRSGATEIIRDPFMSGKLGAFVYGENVAFQNGAGKFLQLGSTNQDTVVNGLFGNFFTGLFPQIVRQYMSVRGRVYPTQSLANAGTNLSICDWLTQYAQAFLNLRCLEGIIDLGNFNQATQLMNSAVQQNLPRLQADLERLRSYAVPQMLVDFLDRLCGPKVIDQDSPVLLGSGQLDPIVDFTVSANIAALLGNAETALNNVANGVSINQSTDFQTISQLFALVYGFPNISPKKISTDMGEVSMLLNQAWTFDNTTSVLNFSWPNTNDPAAGINIPLLIHKDSSSSSVQQMMSLLRTPVYSVDPIAGQASGVVANQVGMIANQVISTHGSYWAEYSQAGSFAGANDSAASSRTLGFQNFQTEFAIWASEANLQVANYGGDNRLLRDFDRVYIPKDFFAEETLWILEHMFMDFS